MKKNKIFSKINQKNSLECMILDQYFQKNLLKNLVLVDLPDLRYCLHNEPSEKPTYKTSYLCKKTGWAVICFQS
jgi:hypothetical protein